MQKTYEVSLWCARGQEIADIYSGTDDPRILKLKHPDMSDCGWIRIGTGTLTANLIEPKDTVQAQVESLEAQIQKAEADAQLTITILRGKINNLLAICNDSGVGE